MAKSTDENQESALAAHYRHGLEGDRLETSERLEGLRTRELLERFLPPSPAVILDVGGAEGAYALPLARQGYEVHLIDPWSPHVEAAATASAKQTEAPLASVAVGDARKLPFGDATADAALLFGPLYHLTDAGERTQSLAEAQRALRPGGVLMAAAISRFASTYDGLRSDWLADPAFETVVEGDLRDGIHRNPDPEAHPEWFTLAYFHRPEDLRAEVEAAGFKEVRILAVEGPGSFREIGSQLDDRPRREALLRAIRRVEAEPALLGASAHLMAVAKAS